MSSFQNNRKDRKNKEDFREGINSNRGQEEQDDRP